MRRASWAALISSGKDERRAPARPLREGRGLRKIEGKRGLSHRRPGRQHDHFLALESPGQVVEVLEARTDPRQLALLHHHLVR